MDAPYFYNIQRDRTCIVEGCDREIWAKRMCTLHYSRSKRGRPLDGPSRMDHGKTCSYKNCKRPYFSGGFCERHYRRNRSGVDMDLPFCRSNQRKHKECEIEGCTDKMYCRRMCLSHYCRWQRGVRGEELKKPIRKWTHRKNKEKSLTGMESPLMMNHPLAGAKGGETELERNWLSRLSMKDERDERDERETRRKEVDDLSDEDYISESSIDEILDIFEE